MKTLATLCLAVLCAAPAFAGPHPYHAGKILSFDTGQQRNKNPKRAAKDEVVYQVQVDAVIYKVTHHSKKQEFSAGQDVQCRVEKSHLIVQKEKGGEVKYDILGESSQPDHGANAVP